MAERTTQKYARTNNRPTEKSFTANLKSGSAVQNSANFTDELISTLSQSYENRRAMQVFEWESIRRGGVSAIKV